jgi:hypothetical protein
MDGFESLFDAAAARLAASDDGGAALPDTQGARDWFAAQLQRLAADPAWAPRRAGPQEWIVRETANTTGRCLRLQPGADAAALTEAGDALWLPAQPGAAVRIRRWRSDRAVHNDVFDPAVRLQSDADFALGAGYLFRVASDALVAHRFEVTRPTLMWRFDARPRLPFVWSFGLDGVPQFLFPAQVRSARLRLVLDYLLAMAHPGAAPFAEALRDAPEYFLRWAAIRALHRLDPTRVRELLGAALADAHPELRATAAGVLAQLDAAAAPA